MDFKQYYAAYLTCIWMDMLSGKNKCNKFALFNGDKA